MELTKLKKLHEEKNIPFVAVADHLGMTYSNYYYIIRGLRKLEYGRAVEIANFFGTTPDEIFLKDFKKVVKNEK